MMNNEIDRVTEILCHPLFVKKTEEIEEKEKDRIFCKHDLNHFLEVARIASIINLKNGFGADSELLYAAALLHDIGRAEDYDHDIAGVKTAKTILSDLKFNDEEVDIILECVGHHRHDTVIDNHKVDIILELIRQADAYSRNCFSCKAREQCYWDENRKNKTLFIE